MNFKTFVQKYKSYPVIKSSYFSLEPNPAYVRRLVSEWQEKGWLLGLRRGMYLINDEAVLGGTERLCIANQLYDPSYVSLESALSFYGLIPEGVRMITSVTTRKTAQFVNPLGTFRYSHIKTSIFSGYHLMKLKDSSVLLGTPEKSLLDLVYLRKREFTKPEQIIDSLRLDNLDRLDTSTLLHTAECFSDHRIMSIATGLLELLK